MAEAFYEKCALSDKDCFLIVERHKTQFTYPLHRHREYELNFIQNGAGGERIVGNSREIITNVDLTLLGGEKLEHVWMQGTCASPDIREITIQFSPDLLGSGLLDKSQFASVRRMLDRSSMGIAFPLEAIMQVYGLLDKIAVQEDRFVQFLDILKILYTLSKYDVQPLADTPSASEQGGTESGRIRKVNDWINAHYAEDLTLDALASMAGMSSTSFSRFYRQKTGQTLSAHIIDVRLGVAARELVNSESPIADICFACGFNNLSNFNRLFKSRHNLTPREFRQTYRKNSAIV